MKKFFLLKTKKTKKGLISKNNAKKKKKNTPRKEHCIRCVSCLVSNTEKLCVTQAKMLFLKSAVLYQIK